MMAVPIIAIALACVLAGILAWSVATHAGALVIGLAAFAFALDGALVVALAYRGRVR